MRRSVVGLRHSPQALALQSKAGWRETEREADRQTHADTRRETNRQTHADTHAEMSASGDSL